MSKRFCIKRNQLWRRLCQIIIQVKVGFPPNNKQLLWLLCRLDSPLAKMQRLRLGARNHKQRPRRNQMLELERVVSNHQIVARRRDALVRPGMVAAPGAVICSGGLEEGRRLLRDRRCLGFKHTRSLRLGVVGVGGAPVARRLESAGNGLGRLFIVGFVEAAVARHAADAGGADGGEGLDAGVGLCGVRRVSPGCADAQDADPLGVDFAGEARQVRDGGFVVLDALARIFEAAGLAGAFALVAGVEGQGVESGRGESPGVVGGCLFLDARHGVAHDDGGAFSVGRPGGRGVELAADAEHEGREGDLGRRGHGYGLLID